jgi:hypothetical protein
MKRSVPFLPAPGPILVSGILALVSGFFPFSAQAAEGGTGHYVPGALGTLIDLPPTQPGWVVEAAYLRYDADVSVDIPIAGLDTAGLDVEVDSFLLGGFYTFALPAEGLYYSLGGFLPYVWMDAEAELRTALGTRRRRDSTSGIGDLTIVPGMLAWKRGSWQLNALLPIYAPTGDYDVGRLANPGLNYWSFDPTLGAAFNSETSGFNAALHAGLMFNTENRDTDYQTGELFHAEASVQQLLPLGPGFASVGAEAFYLDQIGGDSGSGARFGDFERRSWGVGPVLGFVLPHGDNNNFVAELRWLPEIDTTRQLEGDFLWLKVVYQF